MRLKLDENLGHRWRDRFVDAGHDVDTVHAEQLSGASDVDVLAAAVRERRALVTLDLDFANALRFRPEQTAGIAVLRVHDTPGRHDVDIVIAQLIAALDHADINARLWIVEPGRIRQYEASSGDNE